MGEKWINVKWNLIIRFNDFKCKYNFIVINLEVWYDTHFLVHIRSLLEYYIISDYELFAQTVIFPFVTCWEHLTYNRTLSLDTMHKCWFACLSVDKGRKKSHIIVNSEGDDASQTAH